MRKLVVLWKWACEKVFLIEGTKNIMQGLAELRLLGLYLEKSWLLSDLGSDETHWADYGWSPTFLPVLLHATNKCRNSWSATTAGYKVIVVEVPGTFGLQPLWAIEAHRGHGWVEKTGVKCTRSQNRWKHLILKVAEAGLESHLLRTVVVLPPHMCQVMWSWEVL